MDIEDNPNNIAVLISQQKISNDGETFINLNKYSNFLLSKVDLEFDQTSKNNFFLFLYKKKFISYEILF